MKKLLFVLAMTVLVMGVAVPALAGSSGPRGKSNVGHVRLVNKNTTTWEIIPGPLHGRMKYELVGSTPGELEIRVNIHGLDPSKTYQISFNEADNQIQTATDDLLAESACDTGDLFQGGYWDGFSVSCTSPSSEGFYNVRIGLSPNADGDLNAKYTVTFRAGTYNNVKVWVKEEPGTWPGAYPMILWEEDVISFEVK